MGGGVLTVGRLAALLCDQGLEFLDGRRLLAEDRGPEAQGCGFGEARLPVLGVGLQCRVEGLVRQSGVLAGLGASAGCLGAAEVSLA